MVYAPKRTDMVFFSMAAGSTFDYGDGALGSSSSTNINDESKLEVDIRIYGYSGRRSRNRVRLRNTARLSFDGRQPPAENHLEVNLNRLVQGIDTV